MASGIQDQFLEVNVISCSKLKNTEWLSRQDPYVLLQYGNTKLRTRTCTDGGKNPNFQEKFTLGLIEGLHEINVQVWNSKTLRRDCFIGSGRVQLNKVLSQGFDDSPWTLQTERGQYAGDVNLVMHFARIEKQQKTMPCCNPATQPSMLTTQAAPCIHTMFSSSCIGTNSCPPPTNVYSQLPPHSLYPPVSPSPYPTSVCPPPTFQQAFQPQAYQCPMHPQQQHYPPPQAQHFCPPGPSRGRYYPPPY